MALAEALLKYFPTIDADSAFIKLTPSGNYTTGGDTFSISAQNITDPNVKGLLGFPDPGVLPAVCPTVSGYVGFTGASQGSYATVIPGTTQATYKLQQFGPGGIELTGGSAYPAGILAGYWIVEVLF